MKSTIKTNYRFECPSCGNILITTREVPICPCGRKKNFKLLSKKTEEVFT